VTQGPGWGFYLYGKYLDEKSGVSIFWKNNLGAERTEVTSINRLLIKTR
jgi:hypothetical protein